MCHKVLARESQEIFILQDIFTRVKGGGGAVDERYVTLGGCTVQRYEALQGGGGCQVFRKKTLRNT